jgi:hypothetical protein
MQNVIYLNITHNTQINNKKTMQEKAKINIRQLNI